MRLYFSQQQTSLGRSARPLGAIRGHVGTSIAARLGVLNL